MTNVYSYNFRQDIVNEIQKWNKIMKERGMEEDIILINSHNLHLIAHDIVHIIRERIPRMAEISFHDVMEEGKLQVKCKIVNCKKEITQGFRLCGEHEKLRQQFMEME